MSYHKRHTWDEAGACVCGARRNGNLIVTASGIIVHVAGSHPIGEDAMYANEHGLCVRKVRRLGGAKRLQAMSPEARATILGWKNGRKY